MFTFLILATLFTPIIGLVIFDNMPLLNGFASYLKSATVKVTVPLMFTLAVTGCNDYNDQNEYYEQCKRDHGAARCQHL